MRKIEKIKEKYIKEIKVEQIKEIKNSSREKIMSEVKLIEIKKAKEGDLKEILKLQKLAYKSEAEIYNDFNIPPLHQTLEEIKKDFASKIFLKVMSDDKIIGSVRAHQENGTCFIGKLIVHPSFQNQGIGSLLIKKVENIFSDVDRFELFTGLRSEKNLYLYQKLGYKVFKSEDLNEALKLLFLEKYNNKIKKNI